MNTKLKAYLENGLGELSHELVNYDMEEEGSNWLEANGVMLGGPTWSHGYTTEELLEFYRDGFNKISANLQVVNDQPDAEHIMLLYEQCAAILEVAEEQGI